MDGYEGIQKLTRERTDWLPIAAAALREAERTGDDGFAGRWVLNDLRRRGWPGLAYASGQAQTFPGLKLLEHYGLLTHRNSTRRGHRAYYTMPDKEGVRRALEKTGVLQQGA